MDNFPKLRKTVMLDKPEFKLADPNNPVRYQLKPQPMSLQEQKPVEQPEEEPLSAMRAEVRKADRMREVMTAAKKADPLSVIRESEIYPNPEYGDEVDDMKAVHGSIESILQLDPDEALDELDAIDQYDLSDNDRTQVKNSVLEYLKQTGKIDY